MNRTVTPEETRQLFEFCEKKRVIHYDVQSELVDHLASAIEEQWVQSPEMKFEDTLSIIYRKFGIFGFSKLTDEKRKQLVKKYKNLLWGYIRGFYTYPKFIITIVLSTCIYLISKEINNIFLLSIPFAFFIVATGVYMELSYRIKRRKNRNLKKFLFSEIYSFSFQSARSIAMIPFLPIYLRDHIKFDFVIKQDWLLFVVSFVFVGFAILSIGELFFIPKKIKQDFSEQFPEFAACL